MGKLPEVTAQLGSQALAGLSYSLRTRDPQTRDGPGWLNWEGREGWAVVGATVIRTWSQLFYQLVTNSK